MYRNVGKLMKIVAEITVIVLSFICVCAGISLILSEDSTLPLRLRGIIRIILGPLFSWISCMVLYGFGELVEKVCSIEKKLNDMPKKQHKPSEPSDRDQFKRLMFEEDDAEDEKFYNPSVMKILHKHPMKIQQNKIYPNAERR